MISRFSFNLNLPENIKNLFRIIYFKDQNYDQELKNKLSLLYENSNFHFFDHGRTAFYEILHQLKKKTSKRKILVNSLTLFEIINVIIYCGFEPIFIDNKKNSFDTEVNIDNFSSELDNIAAVVITHLNGINSNIINLKKQIDDHNKNSKKIFLIEDCAVSLGSQLDGKNAGTFSDYSFLSFNIMKNITSYTGGVLISKSGDKIDIFNEKYKFLSKFKIINKILFVSILQILNTKLIFPLFFKFIKYSHENSFNFFLKKYRTDFEVKIASEFPTKFSSFMHPFQKKILLKQFNNLKTRQLSRIYKAKIYYDNLNTIKSLLFPQIKFDQRNIFLEFPILCETADIKNNLFEYLMEMKIDIKNYYYKNCSEEKIYNNTKNFCRNSKQISDGILMLPVHDQIDQKYQYQIINEIKNFFLSQN